MSSGERENDRQKQEDILFNNTVTCSNHTVSTEDNVTMRIA